VTTERKRGLDNQAELEKSQRGSKTVNTATTFLDDTRKPIGIASAERDITERQAGGGKYKAHGNGRARLQRCDYDTGL